MPANGWPLIAKTTANAIGWRCNEKISGYRSGSIEFYLVLLGSIRIYSVGTGWFIG